MAKTRFSWRLWHSLPNIEYRFHKGDQWCARVWVHRAGWYWQTLSHPQASGGPLGFAIAKRDARRAFGETK